MGYIDNSDLLISGSWDGFIRIIDLIGGRVLKELKTASSIYGMINIPMNI